MTYGYAPDRRFAEQAFIVNVFGNGADGGNPAPIVLDARGLDSEAMRRVASAYGHESAFILPGARGCDYQFRFFVPNHEMEMCGHATLGATWLLDRLGCLPRSNILISTLSGPVQARVDRGQASISQPKGLCSNVEDVEAVMAVLGLSASDLLDCPLHNAATSRVKTLVPLRSVEILNRLQPDYANIARVCDAIGSTGLYPFAMIDAKTATFSARQFPRSSGYPEDAATGIAASALAWSAWGLGLASTSRVIVRQGEAMGKPSQIIVEREGDHCWLSGHAELVGEVPL